MTPGEDLRIWFEAQLPKENSVEIIMAILALIASPVGQEILKSILDKEEAAIKAGIKTPLRAVSDALVAGKSVSEGWDEWLDTYQRARSAMKS